MGKRKVIIYVLSAFITASLALALYFFIRKPESIAPPVVNDVKKVIVFKDVRYSGEKKGNIDWEIEAKVARKYLDKPLIELEDLTGQYKPKESVLVVFKGIKGAMDTDRETGSIENVVVEYKSDYILKSNHVDFDFKQGLATTPLPVDISGKKVDMKGTGFTANTREETVKLEKDVSGFIIMGKARYRFEAGTLTYHFKKGLYELVGSVVFKGEDLDLSSDRMSVFTTDEELEMVEAVGRVRVASRSNVAKSEKAVYHFREGRVVSMNTPKATTP